MFFMPVNQALVPAYPFVPRAISMVSLDGKTVLTNDGSNYKVHPEDREVSRGWTKYTGQVIIRYNKKIDEFPFTITNRNTGEIVRAEAMIYHDRTIQ
jgi:hypothetical protein